MLMNHVYDEGVMLNILLNNCEGEPKQAIADIDDIGHRRPKRALKEVWKRLDELYGNEAEPVERLLAEIRDFKPISDADNEYNTKALMKLAQICQRIEMANQDRHETRHFTSQIGIKTLVDKTPPRFQSKWRDFVVTCEEQDCKPSFSNFRRRLDRLIKSRTLPMYRKTAVSTKVFVTGTEDEPEDNTKTLATATGDPTAKPSTSARPGVSKSMNATRTPSCAVHRDSLSHSTVECRAFARMTPAARGDSIRSSSCCYRCLAPGHSARECQTDFKCSNCQRVSHHSLLCYSPQVATLPSTGAAAHTTMAAEANVAHE